MTMTTADAPLLLAVGGLPGTGKTTVARRLALACGGELIRTDVVRKLLYPQPTYTPAEVEQVYAEVMRRAVGTLRRGQYVVIDATFQRQSQRDAVEEIARQHGFPWRFVLVTAAEEVIATRLSQRRGDASDADLAVYLHMRAHFEPVNQPHSLLENSGPLEALESQLAPLFHLLGLPRSQSVPM